MKDDDDDEFPSVVKDDRITTLYTTTSHKAYERAKKSNVEKIGLRKVEVSLPRVRWLERPEIEAKSSKRSP